jgi:hypothetical protein
MKTTVWRNYFLFRQIQSEAEVGRTKLNIFRTVNSEWPHWFPSTHAIAAEAVTPTTTELPSLVLHFTHLSATTSRATSIILPS